MGAGRPPKETCTMAAFPKLLRRAFSSSVGVAWKELQATKQTSWRNKPVESGQIVRVNYVTRKAIGSDGFGASDALLDSGRLDFRLGNAKFGAFDEAIPGMRVGDLRRIRAPHTMAYGVDGKPPKIAPFEEVMFDGARARLCPRVCTPARRVRRRLRWCAPYRVCSRVRAVKGVARPVRASHAYAPLCRWRSCPSRSSCISTWQ